MEVISKIVRMRAVLKDMRRQGREVGFVPTMGALHEGHLSLVRQVHERDAEAIVSIFVNPTQFDENTDLDSYPRDLTTDAELLVKEGVKYLFAPSEREMYPAGFCSLVDMAGLTDVMLGKSRPGHFRGVLTVVTKLLHIIEPDFAVFGWKDAQQLIIVRRMVQDLNMDLEIVGAATVREPDGLACSSRNSRLSDDMRKAATSLYRSLQEGRKLIEEGERSSKVVREAMIAILEAEDELEVDHVEIVSSRDLSTMKNLNGMVLLAVCALVSGEGHAPVRLIDNIRIDVATGNRSS